MCVLCCLSPVRLSCHRLQPTRLLCPWDFPGKSIGVICHSLLQRIFLTQVSNPGLLHSRHILYHLSHTITVPKPWIYIVLFCFPVSLQIQVDASHELTCVLLTTWCCEIYNLSHLKQRKVKHRKAQNFAQCHESRKQHICDSKPPDILAPGSYVYFHQFQSSF